MRKIIPLLFIAALLSGCVASSVKGLRDRIPVGYAGTVQGETFLVVGGSAGFTGKNVEKPSKNVITADEWEEHIVTPWGKSSLTLTDAGIGKKKPAAPVVAPVEKSDAK